MKRILALLSIVFATAAQAQTAPFASKIARYDGLHRAAHRAMSKVSGNSLRQV